MMSVFVRCAAILVLAFAALAAPAWAATPPEPIDLDRGWRYATAPEGPWKGVTVPHVFDGSVDERLFDGTIGFYELRFQGPRTNEGWGWEVAFEGVRRRAEVFLNGKRIGANADP